MEELKSLEEEKALLEELPQQSRASLRSDLDALLNNANLMPADVREAAGAMWRVSAQASA